MGWPPGLALVLATARFFTHAHTRTPVRFDPRRHAPHFEEAEQQKLRQELVRLQTENARLAALFTRASSPTPVPPGSPAGRLVPRGTAKSAARGWKLPWNSRWNRTLLVALFGVVAFAAGAWYANELSDGEALRGFQEGWQMERR